MSTHVPGVQSFFRVLASFCNGQISLKQHKGQRLRFPFKVYLKDNILEDLPRKALKKP